MRQIHGYENQSGGKRLVLKRKDVFHDGISEGRAVLGDVTNSQQRGLLPVVVHPHLRDPKPKLEEDGFSAKWGGNFPKGKEKACAESLQNTADKEGLPLLDGLPPCRSPHSASNLAVQQVSGREASASCDDGLHVTDRCLSHRGPEGDGSTHMGCVSSVSLFEHSGKAPETLSMEDRACCDEHGTLSSIALRNSAGPHHTCDTARANTSDETNELKHATGNLSVGDNNFEFAGSQESTINGSSCLVQETLNCSRKTRASTSGIKACNGFIGEHGSVGIEGRNWEEACSCSICLKAAYLWSELQYQDTRGRLAELKRSMKQVKVLIGRNYSHGNPGSTLGENSNKSQLESDLMHRWSSLFRHTEDALHRESKKLQSDHNKLKTLKENCKKDLEMTGSLLS